MSAIQRRGVLLDGIGAELVRASTGGARKTLSKWFADLLAADTALDTRLDTIEAGGAAFADVASAGTVDLGAQSSDKLRITGTTTITSFGTAAAGTRKKLRFAAALTLTYNATSLILPGDASITTAADDYCEAVSLGSGNWFIGSYQRGAGVPVAVSSAMTPVVQAATVALGRVELGFDADLNAFWTAADVAAARTALALGTAALEDVGTSGSVVPLLDGAHTWPATQTFTVPPVFTDAAGTLGALGIGVSGSVAGANTWAALQQFDAGILIKTSGKFQSDSAGAIGPTFNLYHNSASPAANDIVGIYLFSGKDSAGNDQNYADMRCYIDDTTSTSEDAQIQWFTTIGGTYASRMSLLTGLLMAGATGGDKGAGTINAVGVYDDNVLLTDYVFDLHIDGKLHADDANDERALAFNTDWLDPDAFAALWQDRRALPTLPRRSEWREEDRPSVGALARMLWETVEIQAVHIEQLNKRLKALEGQS